MTEVMTKQEKILEYLAEWLEKYCPKHLSTDSGWAILPEVAKERYRQDASKLLTYLDSQGGVLKVERELPENPYADHVHLDAGKYDGLYRKKYFEAQEDMKAAGFDSAFESLI